MIPSRRAVEPAAPTWGEWAGGAGGGEVAVPDERYWRQLAELDEVAAASRTRRTPFVMAGVTLVVAAAAWAVVRWVALLAGADAAGVAGAVVWGASLVAVLVLRRVYDARIQDGWVRRWWVSTTCAAVWVDVVVTLGETMLTRGGLVGMLAVFVLAAVGLGARWADEHEVRDDEPDDEPEPAPRTVRAAATRVPELDPAEVEADAIERDWAERVAAGKKAIAAGSQLVDRQRLPHGWRWTVLLDRNEDVNASALEADGMAARVAHKLGMTATHVMLERLEGDSREHLGMLTVVTRDVLAGGVTYQGPRYGRGAIPIGDYADGTGGAEWLAYDNTGVLCGLITGGQGSGKSALSASLGMSLRRSGEWIVVVGDGAEDGSSSRLLAECAHDFARGSAEVLEQLEGMEALCQVRGHLIGTLTAGPDGKPTPITDPGRQRPVDKILPCPAYPGIVWFIDEFYRLANDPKLQRVNFADRVEAVVRFMRKYGGAVIVITQSALGGDFDGNSDLRGMLAGGNTVAMRAKNKSAHGVVTDGLPPHTLPKGGGYAFLGEGDRQAMIRTAHPDGMEAWLPDVLARGGTPDARSWAVFRRHRQVRELDAGADYAERMAALAAIDAAIVSGAPLPGAQGAADEVPAGGEDEPSSGGFAVPTLTGNVVPIRPDVVAQPAFEPDLRPKEQRVLDALQSRPGAWRTAELVETTGLSAPDVSKALGELVKHGLVHRVARGVHKAPTGDQLNEEVV